MCRAFLAGVGLALAGAVRAAPVWFEEPLTDFLRRPEVRMRIDPARFDHELMVAAIFQETNRVRRELGLKPFVHLAKLDQAAKLKASLGVFEPEVTHESALTTTPAERVKSVGLKYAKVAENIARLPAYDLPAGTKQFGVRQRNGREEFFRLDTGAPLELQTYADFARTAVVAWMNSPGHRANLVNPQLTALGCAAQPCRSFLSLHEQIYAVQVFLRPGR